MWRLQHCVLLLSLVAWYAAKKVAPMKKTTRLHDHTFFWQVPDRDEQFTFYLVADKPLTIRNPRGILWNSTTVLLTWERQEEIRGPVGGYALHVFLGDVPDDIVRNGSAKATFNFKIPGNTKTRFHEFAFEYDPYRFLEAASVGLRKKEIKQSKSEAI